MASYSNRRFDCVTKELKWDGIAGRFIDESSLGAPLDPRPRCESMPIVVNVSSIGSNPGREHTEESKRHCYTLSDSSQRLW